RGALRLLLGLRGALLDLLRLLAARAELGLEPREIRVDLRLGSDLTQLPVEIRLPAGREVFERAGGDQLVDGRGARLHLLRLVLRALDREPRVGHLLADPARGLADLHLRLGGGVLRLDDLLLGTERLDLRLELLLRGDELFLLRLELLDLDVEPLKLL